MTFIMSSWRAGAPGAFRMGWLHGLYCFGCCWLLFAILFPLGVMNIVAMAAISLLIFAEKTLPWGRWSTRAAAAVLLAYGVAAIAVPSLLPTFAAKSTMDMDMSMPMKAGQARDGAASP
jgi:predicted metal-binding membrane protein